MVLGNFWRLLNSVFCRNNNKYLAIAVNLPPVYLDSAFVPFAKPKKKSSKGSLKLEAVNDFNPKISFSDK